jgi:hypothetical protein
VVLVQRWLLQVQQVVQQLLPKLQLDKLPLYALGSANGGAFALTLPMFMQLAGGWPAWCSRGVRSSAAVCMFWHGLKAQLAVYPTGT